VKLLPARSKVDSKFKAGLWVRDSSAGIGTVTFYDRKNGIFAGLGHAVCDVDTGEELPISGGDAVNAAVKGCYKGKDGSPGELCGVFAPGEIGELYENCVIGGACRAPRLSCCADRFLYRSSLSRYHNTAVFINDPLKGYAIFAQTMAEEAERISSPGYSAAL